MSKGKLGVLLLGLAQLTCHQAILTAPPGSTIALFANPPFIPANGGVSIISALVIEPAGTPVADGTVVQFFATLGIVPEQAKTNDGVARVNFVSDSRSGTARIFAFSGGPAAAPPAPSPAPSPTAPPTTGGSGTSFVDVVIGSALPARVFVTAEPVRIEATDPRESFIIANVLDSSGNTVANVPVIFTVADADGNPSTERMVSEGAPRFTDNSGRAEDIMRTKYPVNQPAKTVTVTATTANGIAGTVKVTIN